MDETKITPEGPEKSPQKESSQKQIAGAILIAGLFIAGAILLKDSTPPLAVDKQNPSEVNLKPISKDDNTLGSPEANVALIMYEDFQCPWCGKFDREAERAVRDAYVKMGKVQLVYRDFAFLGPESGQAAEASHCAADQGKFWEYHDYLFDHQNGENKGAFSDANLKSFASVVGLNAIQFNNCLDTNKYEQKVAASRTEGASAGVRGTPKGFILKNGKLVDTIDGYLATDAVLQKIEAALK